jgi:hypothetical protein
MYLWWRNPTDVMAGLPLHVMAALEAAIHSADCEMDGRVKPAHDMVWIAAI